MKKGLFLFLLVSALMPFPSASSGKELTKLAVWDLAARNIPADYAYQLTAIVVSEISNLQTYEAYSQDNVRALTGWTADRMTLGCTDTRCLTALGQMEIEKLISGSVGKIGSTFSISLNLFDTRNLRTRSISSECRSEDELIPLIRQTVRRLVGEEAGPSEPIDALPYFPFRMDSMKSKYAFGAEIWGHYRLLPASIEITVSQAILRLRNQYNYTMTDRLNSVCFGLATAVSGGGWKVFTESSSLLLQKIVRPGENHSLQSARFSMPFHQWIDLPQYWLVLKIEGGYPNPNVGLCYTHSDRGIFLQHSR